MADYWGEEFVNGMIDRVDTTLDAFKAKITEHKNNALSKLQAVASKGEAILNTMKSFANLANELASKNYFPPTENAALVAALKEPKPDKTKIMKALGSAVLAKIEKKILDDPEDLGLPCKQQRLLVDCLKDKTKCGPAYDAALVEAVTKGV